MAGSSEPTFLFFDIKVSIAPQAISHLCCNSPSHLHSFFSFWFSYMRHDNSIPDLNTLLTSFYQLANEARTKTAETIQFRLQYHLDREHAQRGKQSSSSQA